MKREIRYYSCDGHRNWMWYLAVPEHHWNEVEQQFAAVLDAAFTNEEAENNYVMSTGRSRSCEWASIPNFGTKIHHNERGLTVYYTADLNSEPDYNF